MPGYKNKNKEELIVLLKQKDERERTLMERIENIESQLKLSEAKYDRLVNIERQIFQQQQYSRRDCVEIVGIPKEIPDEHVEAKVIELFHHAEVEVTERSFHAVHRLKNKSVVIAKCVNRKDAVSILRAKKKLRVTDDTTKVKLGVPGKVYVNESLCPEYRRLFGICNSLFKHKHIHNNFTVNGTIKITLAEGGPKHDIHHLHDLINIVGSEIVQSFIEAHERKKVAK